MKEKDKQAEGLEAQEYIGSDEPSMLESVDKLFGGSDSDSDSSEEESGTHTQDDAALSQNPSSDDPGSNEDSVANEEESAEKTKTKESADDNIPDIEAEGMFGEGGDEEEEAKPESFDEKEFDAQTAKILKSLEDKGHPGDVYKDLRAQLKEAKQKLESGKIPEDVEKQLEEYKARAEEADALKERLEEVSSVSAKVRMEASDAYQKEVLRPAQEILLSTKELSESYGIDQGSLNAVITESDRKIRNQLIETHLQDFSEMDRQDVYSMIRKYGDITAKQNSMLEKAEEELESRKLAQDESQSKEKAERQKQFRTIADSIWSKYEDKIPGLLDDTGNLDPEFAKLKKKALTVDPSRYSARDEAYTAYTGTIFPALVKRLIKLERQLQTYEADDEKATRSRPKSTPATTNIKNAIKDDDDGILARLNKAFPG